MLFLIVGLRPTSSDMSWKATVQEIQTKHGDKQGAQAEEWSRELVQVRSDENIIGEDHIFYTNVSPVPLQMQRPKKMVL